MEETILEGKTSRIILINNLIAYFIIMLMTIGFSMLISYYFLLLIIIEAVFIAKNLINFFTTKLIITNKRVRGKKGLFNTNELDSPLNKITGVRMKQGLDGKIKNYGTVSITTSSTVFDYYYIENPNEFKTILNNQIEKYDEERIEQQARKIVESLKN